MTGFATVDDVIAITGKDYTQAELERIVTIIPLLSDALRMEAMKVGKDLDEMVETSRALLLHPAPYRPYQALHHPLLKAKRRQRLKAPRQNSRSLI